MQLPLRIGIWKALPRNLALACSLAAAIHGQNSPQPQFDVASVKPSTGRTNSVGPDRSGGRIRWTVQLAYVLGYAYKLDLTRLEGGGSTLGHIYSFEATFNPAATDDQVRLMLRSLLADRFKMQSRLVTAETDGYALTVGRRGLKISEAKDGDAPPPLPDWVSDRSPEHVAASFIDAWLPERGVIALTGRRVSMSQLAQNLERGLGKPVRDETGLKGNYYFAFHFSIDAPLRAQASPEEEPPVLYPRAEAALRDNLGIELVKRKVPVERLVVDHIEEPSEN